MPTFTLPLHFGKLLSNIEPPAERKQASALIPGQVREYLEETDRLATVWPHSRLTGSYARATATGDIKDVDLLVFVEAEIYRENPAGAVRALRAALQGLPQHLNGGGEATLRMQRRSVHVYFDNHDFHLDVVPAILDGSTDNPLEVPDRPWSKWIASDPLNYARELSKLNTNHGEKAVPLIKLFKHWRDEHFAYKRPKSYWLEALTYQHLVNGGVETTGKGYAEIALALFRSVYDTWLSSWQGEQVPTVADPMLDTNVAFNWEWSHFDTFMRRLEESIGWAERALSVDDYDTAVSLWGKVFGDAFPVSVEEEAATRAALLSGGVFVSSTGRLSGTPPATGSAVRARSHTFHGEEA